MSRAQPSAPTVLIAHPSADLYGSDRMTLETVSALREAGSDVVLVLPADGPLAAQARHRGARVVVCRTPVLRKSGLSPRGLIRLAVTTLAALPAGIRLLRRTRPAAVYVATVTLPLWLLLARTSRISTICHVHEAERGLPQSVRRLLAVQLRLAHRVVVNSEVTRNVVVEDCPAVAGRVQVVHNGVAAPPAVVPSRAVLEPPLRLAFVGRLSARKGADLAVDTVLRLRDLGVPARLDVVGDAVAGSPEYRDELLRRVRDGGLGDVVTFSGFVADVWPHLQAADLVLVPSRGDESFGNAAAESLLAARPVLVADVPGLREVTAGYPSAQVVGTADPGAWADAVLAVQAAWPSVREQAVRDASAASQALSPARYRSRMVEIVHSGTGQPAVLEGSPR